MIELSNSIGLSTRYDLNITYKCDDEIVPDEIPLNSYELRYDIDAPVPYIHSVGFDGIVKIRFSEIMQPQASLLESETYDFEKSNKIRVLFDDQNGQEYATVGRRSETFGNFTMLHNSTVRINGTWH